MKILLICVAALTMSGCSTLGGDPTNNLPQAVLDNLKYCKRTYQASVGGLGIPGGSLYIECAPAPAEPPP